MKNRYQPNNNNRNFDLDSYLEEKASASSTADTPQKEESNGGNFFRNLMLISALLIVAVLYSHNWNPMNLYHRFFPEEQTMATTFPQVDEERIARITEQQVREAENRARRLADQAERAALNETMREEMRTELDAQVSDNEFSEDIARLTEESTRLAMESAFEALNDVNWEELGVQLEGIGEQIEAEMLREFANSNEYQNLAENAENLSLQEYSILIEEMGIDQFSEEDLSNLHEAEVPVSLIKVLNESGRLTNYTSQELIDFFN